MESSVLTGGYWFVESGSIRGQSLGYKRFLFVHPWKILLEERSGDRVRFPRTPVR